MHIPLSESASISDDRLATVLLAFLAIWLLWLTVSLLYDVFRLLIGIRLLIAAAFIIGIPLTAIVVAAVSVL